MTDAGVTARAAPGTAQDHAPGPAPEVAKVVRAVDPDVPQPVRVVARDHAPQPARVGATDAGRDAPPHVVAAPAHAQGHARVAATPAVDVTQDVTQLVLVVAREDAIVTARIHAHLVQLPAIATVPPHAPITARVVAKDNAQDARIPARVVVDQVVPDARVPVRVNVVGAVTTAVQVVYPVVGIIAPLRAIRIVPPCAWEPRYL